MKKLILSLILSISASAAIAQTQVKVITVVESIVPMGIGRSRIIESVDTLGINNVPTTKTYREEIRVNNYNEYKLLNMYSGVGINFQNIASNDAIVSSKLMALLREGWKISFVVGGVESNAGKDDGQGIFVTRYILTK
jgi:hypothetical protein